LGCSLKRLCRHRLEDVASAPASQRTLFFYFDSKGSLFRLIQEGWFPF
jgi:hypothetical protein